MSQAERYVASDGSLWHVTYDPPPVPTRAWDWQWASDDYDGGAPDGFDPRCGVAPTREAAIQAVEEWVGEQE